MRDLQQGTGSLYYVNEKLSVILNTEPKPKFTGAIILDSIMNYNHSQNSQYLPHNFETVLIRILSQTTKNVFIVIFEFLVDFPRSL